MFIDAANHLKRLHCILKNFLIFSLVTYHCIHTFESQYFYKLLLGSSTTVKELLGSTERRVTEGGSGLCPTS
jgi:hypothetical protein